MGVAVDAEAISDHRTAYLEYEGPVSGGRGQVRRWDAGEFVFLVDTPEKVNILLCGGRCKGSAVLERGTGEDWSFTLRNEK